MEFKAIFDSGFHAVDSRYWISVFVGGLGDSGFQSLVGFRIPSWVVFRIPKPNWLCMVTHCLFHLSTLVFMFNCLLATCFAAYNSRCDVEAKVNK